MAQSIFVTTEAELHKAQAKITYLGVQTKPIPTVTYSVEGYPISMNLFLAVQRKQDPYMNDQLPYTKAFTVTVAEFHRMLTAIKPVVTSTPAVGDAEFLSFSVTRETDAGIEGQEFRIGPHTGKEFYEKLIAALVPENHSGRAILTKQFVNVLPQ